MTTTTGTSGNDVVNNTGSGTTINTLAGNDKINDSGTSSTIDGGDGDDEAILTRSGASNYTLSFVDGGTGSTAASDGTKIANVEHLFLVTGAGNDNVTFVNPTYDATWGGNRWNAGAGADTATVDLSASTSDIDVSGDSTGITFHSYGLGGNLLVLLNVENVVVKLGSVDGSVNLTALTGNMKVYGGNANDCIFLGSGNDTVTCGNAPGYNTVDTGAGNDTIVGGAGADYIAGGTGNDKIDGRGGSDTVQYCQASSAITVNLNLTSAQTIGGGQGVDTLSNIENITASAYDDTLIGNGADNLIDGWGGNDSISGGAGNDTLYGSANSVVDGGDGNDIVYYTFGATSGGIKITGGSGDDTIYAFGNLTGSDSIDGGSGSDMLLLDGDYSKGVALAAVTNIETIKLAAAYSNYKLTASDTTVAAGQKLTVDASALDASTALIFSGSAEKDGSFVLIGGGGADSLSIGRSGKDVITANAGDDTVNCYAYLKATDSIDGGADTDTVKLAGNYSAGLTLGATTILNVERLSLAAAYNYGLTTNTATVAAGAVLTVDASALGSANWLNFNGSAETDGKFALLGGAGNDTLAGGSGADILDLTKGGNDLVHANGGNDIINCGAALTADDTIDGGSGTDMLQLSGDYSAGLTFGAATLVNVENISLAAGSSYKLTGNDAMVTSGHTLKVDGSALGSSNTLYFKGASETSGSLVLTGGAGKDTLIGGGGADTLTGGLGADTLYGNGGADRFVYTKAVQSSDSAYDTISGFDTASDKIDTWTTVSGIDTALASGALSSSSFDANLADALSGKLKANHAILFTPNTGTLAGKQFLVIDTNGKAGYQAGADLVIRMSSPTNLTGLAIGTFT